MKSILSCAFTAWLVLFSMSAPAEPSGRELMDKALDYVASAPAIRRVDTSELSAVVLLGQNRGEQKSQTNVVTIEIDRSKHLARQTATIQGQELIMLKQGEKAAMKLGAGRWEVPTGLYENIAKDMGNLFVCEIETPETRENAPALKVAGTELLDGHEAFVIETEGNTAVSIAQERMTKAIPKQYLGNPAQRPTVKVLAYSARHWIGKSDYRHLQAVQISKVQMSLVLPDGTERLMEQSTKATSKYSYDKVTIEIPQDARKILSLSKLP